MAALSNFLQKPALLKRNRHNSTSPLPLVHTTRGLHIKKIQKTGEISVRQCNVFREDLNYFFVGRPAYKHKTRGGISEYWELPVCFIIEFNAVSDIKRVFPFDSGAFDEKRMPDFIQMMDREEFELGSSMDLAEKIIGAFFGSPESYFSLKAKPERIFEREFSLGVFDEEIRALHLLALNRGSESLDDRKFCIEVQSSSNLKLDGKKLLAVVCPSIYLDDVQFRNHVELTWRAEAISYQYQSLNYQNYMSEIYNKIADFYITKNILKSMRKS